MAFASYNVSSVDDILDGIADFASNMGWAVTPGGGAGSKYSIKHLSLPGAVVFEIGGPTSGAGLGRGIYLYADRSNNTTITMVDIGPYTRVNVANPTTYGGSPSVLRMHGEMGDSPWIFASVECASNGFRNLCFGYLDRLGDYGGGEFYTSSNRDMYDWDRGGSMNQWADSATAGSILFGGNTRNPSATGVNTAHMGGVRVGNRWVYFNRHLNDQERVIGAPPLLSPLKAPLIGRNSFSGYSPFIPINLYVGNMTTTSGFWVPIGTPIGVRSVDMRNFFPLEVTTLADGSTWRIYPSVRKGTMTQGVPVDEESSGPLGYAVRESI